MVRHGGWQKYKMTHLVSEGKSTNEFEWNSVTPLIIIKKFATTTELPPCFFFIISVYRHLNVYTQPFDTNIILYLKYCVNTLNLSPYVTTPNSFHGQFRNCQSSLFITVHGQFYSGRLGLYCQVTIWENTKESIIPVCDKPYHKIKENITHLEELENLWNYALAIKPSVIAQTKQFRRKKKHLYSVVYLRIFYFFP